jgi:hypothetical protein
MSVIEANKQLFNTPEETMDYLHDLLSFHAEMLGIRFVGYGEERLIPEYPAVLIGAGTLNREVHATHTFQLTLMLELFIYHAKLSESHHTRTREDLKLVTRVREVLHDNLVCPDDSGTKQVIFSYVNAEDPVFIRRPRNEAVVGSRMEWLATTQERFARG